MNSSDATAPHCHVCAAAADPTAWLHEHGGWFVFGTADVPGWVMLATRAHVEGPWSLSADDAATLGPALRDVARAVKTATAAERIHVVFLGENALHVHFGFFPRASGEPALLDNGPMIEAMRTADANRAASIRDAVCSLLRGT